MRGSS
ncbi:rCG27664 [Rattus norvegicus]